MNFVETRKPLLLGSGSRKREYGKDGITGTNGGVLRRPELSVSSDISVFSVLSSLWPQIAQCVFVGAFLLLTSLPALAQQRPLITEDVETVKPGSARFEAGVDFLQDKNYP